MSETRITDNGIDVIYKMSPFIAEELAEVLNHAAKHKVDGSLRKPAKYDQGWLMDAEALKLTALGTTEDDDGN